MHAEYVVLDFLCRVKYVVTANRAVPDLPVVVENVPRPLSTSLVVFSGRAAVGREADVWPQVC